jgi:two-component system, chemotaxis family, response regulator WspF
MRIAIVNDLPVAVEAMRRLLVASGKHEIAWTACDGVEAVHFCRRDRPEIVLMDLIMPNKDGVEATREIMAESPCPILIVTDAVETNPGKVFDAMGAGALDVVRAPSLAANGRGSSFLFKIDSVGRLLRDSTPAVAPPKPSGPAECLVAIGSSAGGPAALAVLLRELPADFPAAIVIVQHVDAHFAPGLAKWLGESSKLPVRAAERGDVPSKGCVLLASSNDHLVFDSPIRLDYTPHPVEYSYRPSVNAFFESAARRWRNAIIGVLLTGMGSDGAAGLKALRNRGHYTIAQDRATSAVYGMPKAAADLGAAMEILPLVEIAPALCNRILSRKKLPASTPS